MDVLIGVILLFAFFGVAINTKIKFLNNPNRRYINGDKRFAEVKFNFTRDMYEKIEKSLDNSNRRHINSDISFSEMEFTRDMYDEDER